MSGRRTMGTGVLVTKASDCNFTHVPQNAWLHTSVVMTAALARRRTIAPKSMQMAAMCCLRVAVDKP
jgi:hypothetical protein